MFFDKKIKLAERRAAIVEAAQLYYQTQRWLAQNKTRLIYSEDGKSATSFSDKETLAFYSSLEKFKQCIHGFNDCGYGNFGFDMHERHYKMFAFMGDLPKHFKNNKCELLEKTKIWSLIAKKGETYKNITNVIPVAIIFGIPATFVLGFLLAISFSPWCALIIPAYILILTASIFVDEFIFRDDDREFHKNQIIPDMELHQIFTTGEVSLDSNKDSVESEGEQEEYLDQDGIELQPM